MAILTYEDLVTACSAGGASVLTSVTELAAAGGPHTAVAPARFVDGSTSVFAYETRYIDGDAQNTVILDSKQSQLNRVEAPLALDMHYKHPIISRVPHLSVTYGDVTYTDLELPHRAYDGHFRAGTVDGNPATAHPLYRAARDASPANARALLEFSPTSLVFGAWDATRKSRQGRYRSALVGEIIGVLADQGTGGLEVPKRGGARVDPVAMSVQLDGKKLTALVEAQQDELSPALVEKTLKSAKGTKPVSGSVLGLGGIPPSLDSPGAVACSRIIRSHVLSFSALRQLRFGSDAAGDAAARALLAAYALAGLARSDSELSLRANCDLIECGPSIVTIDERHGASRSLDSLTIEQADALLAEALAGAESAAGIQWQGQTFEVVGNPDILRGASDANE